MPWDRVASSVQTAQHGTVADKGRECLLAQPGGDTGTLCWPLVTQ